MNRKDNKKCKTSGLPLVPDIDDDLFPLPDFEDAKKENSPSSNWYIFENRPVVMQLHGAQRDEELPADNPLPEVKARKVLKKRRPKPENIAQEQSAASLTSGSETSLVPPGPEKQEEFYDANETYYDFPENQQPSATALRILNVAPEPDPPQMKPVAEINSQSDATTTAAPATQDTGSGQTPIPSAVTKPVHPSNPD